MAPRLDSAQDHVPADLRRPQPLRTAAACALAGAVASYATLGGLTFITTVGDPSPGEALPAWVVWLWMAPAYAINAVLVTVPAWTILVRSTRRPLVALSLMGAVGGGLFGAGLGVGLAIGGGSIHTHWVSALTGTAAAWAPMHTLTGAAGGLAAAILARRFRVGGEQWRRGPALGASAWLFVTPAIAVAMGAFAIAPNDASRLACEEPKLSPSVWRGEGEVTVRSDNEEPAAAPQVVWLDPVTKEMRFEGTPADPSAVRTQRGSVVASVTRSVRVIGAGNPPDRTTSCSGMARRNVDDPWHFVALAAANHQSDARTEERLRHRVATENVPFRNDSEAPSGVRPFLWSGLGGKVALWSDERSGMPLAADIATSNTTWRIEWRYGLVEMAPADGIEPMDMAATADTTVSTSEGHYWTLPEARAFKGYAVYYVGPTHEGYDVAFVRRTSQDRDPARDQPLCNPEDGVSTYYMARFGEHGAGRRLSIESRPPTDCARGRIDRSTPVTMQRSDMRAYLSYGGQLSVELPDGVVQLSGGDRTVRELADLAEGLVPVNASAFDD